MSTHDDPSSKPAPRSTDALAQSAADLLGEVVRNSERPQPPSPRGERLLARLKQIARPEPLAADDARAMVAAALAGVPEACRGSSSAWNAMIDAVASRLYESDAARPRLEALWAQLSSPEEVQR